MFTSHGWKTERNVADRPTGKFIESYPLLGDREYAAELLSDNQVAVPDTTGTVGMAGPDSLVALR